MADFEDITPDTSPGQHGSNFNAPYRGVVAQAVAPGPVDEIRQAIRIARLRRLRQAASPSLSDIMNNVAGPPLTPMQEAGQRLSHIGGAIIEGLMRGVTDTADMAAQGPAMRAFVQLDPGASPDAVAATHNPNPALQAADAIGLTHSDYTPPDADTRAVLEGARFLGGGIVPETAIARFGMNVARRVSEGAAESSLSRAERIALDYVRQPGRTLAANVTGAAGSVVGGHAAAAINPALEPIGQILGGLAGGAAPFAGRGHAPSADDFEEVPPASLATVEPETPNTPGIITATPEVQIAPHDPVAPSAPRSPVAANDSVSANDPAGPYRDQAIREHAAAHDLTPVEAAEMYWTNENPGFTASIRDRTNELLQNSVVESNTPVETSEGPNRQVVGNLPREGLAPANVGSDGRLYVGEMGEGHVDVINRYPEGVWSGETGFVNPEGQFLNRAQALEYANSNGERIRPSDNMRGGPGGDELDASDYRDQSDLVPPPEWGTRRAGWEQKAAIRRGEATSYAPTSESLSGGDNGSGDKPPQPPEEPPVPPSDGGDEPPHPSDSVVQRLTAALNRARRLSPEQKAATSAARSEKIAAVRGVREGTSGESGYHAELSQLKGELPRVQFEGVRDQFTQPEIDSLFDRIKDHPTLSIFEQINARAGLAKLLDGALPTPSELSLLGRTFPKDFISSVLRNRTFMQKLMNTAANVLNIPRALMSSFDLSAPYRQGLFLVGRKEFYQAMPEMVRQFVKGFGKTDDAFETFMDDIRARPNYDLMTESKLALGTVDHNLTTREEAFMSPYAEKIPVVGRVVKASERAYTAYLNKLRADVFDSLVSLHADEGIDLSQNPKQLRDIASFINNATGRGNLGKLNSSAPLLNAAFFSPRLIASRVTLLNPVYYATLSPIVRREAIKSLLSLGGIATTVLGLAAAGGMRVETDMRSADFGKIRNGDVRYDILGGFGQYLTLGARLVTNETKSLDGQVSELGGRYGARTRFDTLVNFTTNKFSPIASFVTDYLRGKDPTGQPFNLTTETINHLTPLFVQDIIDVTRDKGPTGPAQALPGAFGVGIQTIPPSHNIDHLGRRVSDLPETETDPAALEVNRLNTNPNSQLIGTPRRNNISIDDPLISHRNLTDQEFEQYQEASGRRIHDEIRQEMSTPEWRRMSDDDKRDEIRSIVRNNRADVRDEMFNHTPAAPAATVGHSGGDFEDISRPSTSSTSSLNDFEEVFRPIPGHPVSSATAVVQTLFPGVQVTQGHRDPESRLGRANPSSWHNVSNAAVDVRPIRGITFDEYVGRIRDAGYHIIEQIDEVRHPSRWATGPHWHVVIGV